MVNNIMHSLHLFLVSLGLGSSMMNITKTSPESSTMVLEGEFLVMSCEADQPWFLCVWTSPLGGKQCAIQVDNLKKYTWTLTLPCRRETKRPTRYAMVTPEYTLRVESTLAL